MSTINGSHIHTSCVAESSSPASEAPTEESVGSIHTISINTRCVDSIIHINDAFVLSYNEHTYQEISNSFFNHTILNIIEKLLHKIDVINTESIERRSTAPVVTYCVTN